MEIRAMNDDDFRMRRHVEFPMMTLRT